MTIYLSEVAWMTTLLPTEPYSLADLASVVLVMVGGVFGLWQYYRTNTETRARAAADEFERFNGDEAVRTALRVIDWYSGTITVVDEIGTKHKREYTPLDFHLALRPHSKRRCDVRQYVASEDKFRADRENRGLPFDDYFSYTELYLREVFDLFLGRLERIEMLIECGVIGKENFGDVFSYWLYVIGDEKKSGDELDNFSNAKRETLIEYLKYYQFRGVLRLFARYGKPL
ncbi:hypothetical protein DTW90_23890 [Neorhizobium sp. P12A]|uniref:hypothetical protein n=1 Tax=Neorhizobium sp. P12A TaxID=2268027 RepID=UPI0011EBAE00|nr:hypothetical protein [Neorhizobium sp. P12A]KAA0694374.1 hypothetical protein DTW90_23890 [Neorhizobium sp. P12A]